VAHFRQFFKTSGLSCRQRMTLNTLSSLVVGLGVIGAAAVAVQAVIARHRAFHLRQQLRTR